MSAIDELANEFDKRIQIEKHFTQLKPVKRKSEIFQIQKMLMLRRARDSKKE